MHPARRCERLAARIPGASAGLMPAARQCEVLRMDQVSLQPEQSAETQIRLMHYTGHVATGVSTGMTRPSLPRHACKQSVKAPPLAGLYHQIIGCTREAW
jgi:hypothetical protein